jgi:hypothetical protein
VGNDFTSFYVRFGGPVTLQEINTLPYSLWTGITGSDIRTGYFFNTLIINAGFAQGFAIFRSGMFVCGIQSSFLAQWAEDPEVLDHMRAMTNSYVLPCAVEYNLGRVALRMGMYVRYYYEDERTWDDRFPIETEKKVRHTFSTGRSLGLSWQITDRFNIDFLYMRNRSVMYYIDAWTRCHICLKYFL